MVASSFDVQAGAARRPRKDDTETPTATRQHRFPTLTRTAFPRSDNRELCQLRDEVQPRLRYLSGIGTVSTLLPRPVRPASPSRKATGKPPCNPSNASAERATHDRVIAPPPPRRRLRETDRPGFCRLAGRRSTGHACHHPARVAHREGPHARGAVATDSL